MKNFLISVICVSSASAPEPIFSGPAISSFLETPDVLRRVYSWNDNMPIYVPPASIKPLPKLGTIRTRTTPTPKLFENIIDIPGNALEYTFEEIALATNDFDPANKLGKGGAGTVYKGRLQDGTLVGVKQMSPDVYDGKRVDGFHEEVKISAIWRHPNIVNLIGYTIATPEETGEPEELNFPIYEFMAGGDLAHKIRDAGTGKITYPALERVSDLLEAALGYAHIHNSTPQVIHRDIKPANILIDEKGRVKIADFGIAVLNYDNLDEVPVQHVAGTPGFIDPAYKKTKKVSEFTDVYAFGMVIMESLTTKAPARSDKNAPNGIVDTWAQKMTRETVSSRYLDRTARWPQNLSDKLIDLALRCIKRTYGETSQPSFVEIVDALQDMVDENMMRA